MRRRLRRRHRNGRREWRRFRHDARPRRRTHGLRWSRAYDGRWHGCGLRQRHGLLGWRHRRGWLWRGWFRRGRFRRRHGRWLRRRRHHPWLRLRLRRRWWQGWLHLRPCRIRHGRCGRGNRRGRGLRRRWGQIDHNRRRWRRHWRLIAKRPQDERTHAGMGRQHHQQTGRPAHRPTKRGHPHHGAPKPRAAGTASDVPAPDPTPSNPTSPTFRYPASRSMFNVAIMSP